MAEKCRDFDKQIQLVAELEIHVDQLQQIRSLRASADGRSSVDILRDISPSAGAIRHNPEHQAGTPAAPGFTTPEGLSSPDAGSNLLPIVQAQRER